jgi:endonuclease/exonuclease/phosphatase family metal-dependent hydrolase
MRVVSWNLWWRFGPDWKQRQSGILTTLAGLRPDLVGLQEVWADGRTSQAHELARELGMYAVFAAPSLPPVPHPPESRDQEGIELGVAVLSRWPLKNASRHGLPSANRAEPVALLATIDHPAGPLHFCVSCVEWEPAFAADHLAQTQALADLLADEELDGRLPVVLAADLNTPPGSVELKPLTDVMVDTWRVGGGTEQPTLSSVHPQAPVQATKQIDQRIDYVLARPGRRTGAISVDQAFLAGTQVDGLYPSDHFAVVIDLVVPAA